MGRKVVVNEQPATSVDALILALHGAETRGALAERLLAELRARFKPPSCVLCVRRGDVLVPFRWFGAGEEVARHRIRVDSAVGERLRTGVPLHVADIRGDVIRDMGGRTAFPCVARGELQVVVVVDAKDRDVDLRALVAQLAPHVALAYDNLGRSPVDDGPQVQPTAPQRVLELTTGFGRPGTVSTVGWRVVSAAVDAVLAARGVLYLFDPAYDELRQVAAVHLLDKAREHRVNRGADDAHRVPPGLGPAGDVLLTGVHRLIEDVGRGGVDWWPDTHARGAFLFLPLKLSGEVVAVLGLNRDRLTPVFQHGATVLAPILDRGAVALDRVRLMEPLVVDAETALYDGRFVEALLGEAIARAEDSGSRVSVLSIRVGESSTHRVADRRPPPLLETADALRAASEQDIDLVGHLGHGRFVAIVEDTGADVAHTIVDALLESLAPHRGDAAIHAAAVVERRLGEDPLSVWSRAHSLLNRIYDEGPGVRVGVATQLRERVVREHVPEWATPVDPERR